MSLAVSHNPVEEREDSVHFMSGLDIRMDCQLINFMWTLFKVTLH